MKRESAVMREDHFFDTHLNWIRDLTGNFKRIFFSKSSGKERPLWDSDSILFSLLIALYVWEKMVLSGTDCLRPY